MNDGSDVSRGNKPCAQQVGRIRRTRAKSRSQKSIFPQKLWRMVNDQRLYSAIKWTEDGQSFVIDENLLRIMCLGKENNLFYTKQPKSFVRQLHLYGFRKINKNQFSHKYFNRDQPDLLKFIKRSYKPIQNSVDDSENVENDSQNNPMIDNTKNKVELNDVLAAIKVKQNPNSMAAGENYKLESGLNPISAFSDSCVTSIDITSGQELPQQTVGALVFPNNYDEDCLQPSISWYEGNYLDNNYNYNEDSILTLYNNDIYPNTYDDNNITL